MSIILSPFSLIWQVVNFAFSLGWQIFSFVAPAVLGFILVGYFLPHVITCTFFRKRNLRRAYQAEWALVTGASSGKVLPAFRYLIRSLAAFKQISRYSACCIFSTTRGALYLELHVMQDSITFGATKTVKDSDIMICRHWESDCCRARAAGPQCCACCFRRSTSGPSSTRDTAEMSECPAAEGHHFRPIALTLKVLPRFATDTQ